MDKEEDMGKCTLTLFKNKDGTSVSSHLNILEKRVKKGEDITISWKANCEVDGQWKKDDQVLQAGGRIRITQSEDHKCFTLIINCDVDGQWKNDDQVLQDGGRIWITQSEDHKRFTLRITNAQEEDEGKYTLELSNSEGNALGSAEVKILVPPEPPAFKDICVKKGEDITFSWEANCEVDGQWKKDDQVLQDGCRIWITESEDHKRFILIINNAHEEDEGKYTLELSNSEGNASGSAEVTILVPPQPEPPTFEEKHVKKGEDITLSWEANYEVEGQWKKDDQVLQDGGRIRITQSENPKRFTLRITNAQEEDEGKYTLELSNSEGNASGSAEVKILVPPKPKPPAFEEKRVKKGEDITFSWEANCEVDGQWKKDAQVLQDGGRIWITQSEDHKRFTLIINNAQEDDEGKYTLEVSNSEGNASGSAEVKILAKAYVLDLGHTVKAQGEFMEHLKPVTKVTHTEEDSDFILAFCGAVSRVRTDINAALKKIPQDTGKQAILVVLHQTFDENYAVPRADEEQQVLIVHCLMNKDNGLLKCPQNDTAIQTVKDKIKKL